jgi:hypothetical protein
VWVAWGLPRGDRTRTTWAASAARARPNGELFRGVTYGATIRCEIESPGTLANRGVTPEHDEPVAHEER